MSVLDLYRDEDVHGWISYNPVEPQYYKYEANIVAAGFKIVDVYESFCNARQSLLFIETDNYGKLVAEDDELNMKSIRSYFLMNALAYYNYCIDLSWQVPWLFYGESHLGLIHKEDAYLYAIKECTLENLKYRLTLARDHKLKWYVEDFFHDTKTVEIREKYNYIKHRGTIYFKGLGVQDAHLKVKVSGMKHRMLTKETWDIDEWKYKLMDFDISFKNYFEWLIYSIMPRGYCEPTFAIDDVFNYHNALQAYIEESESK